MPCKTRSRTMLVALLSLALTACASGPSATVERFYRLTEAGEATQAMDLVATPLKAQFGDKMRTGILQQTASIREKGGIKSIECRDEVVTGEQGTLTAITTFGNGTVTTEQVRLIKENGRWKLSGNK